MDTLIIIEKNKIIQELNLELGLLSLGMGLSCDIKIPMRENASISLLRKIDSLIPTIHGGEGRLSGPWNKKVSKECILEVDEIKLIYLPNTQGRKASLKDWDSMLLPTRPDNHDYPEKLLSFLLRTIEADQGAILLFQGETLKTIASKKIELQDQSELFLQRTLEARSDENIITMNYSTHTLLFKAGLTPLDFCLIQQPIDTGERLVLYLPKTKGMGLIPHGILSTLLNLSAGNIISHLLFKQRAEFQRKKGNVEFDFFWGSSEKMKSLKTYVDKLSQTNLSVLIEGETGTGKEMLVNYIKQRSKMKKIVSVNCAAIPKDLAESLLFGHIKGSFTGAHQNQKGKIEEADGGILFLDEIGELDIEIQAKLLRTIQDSKITPVGGQETSVKFWLISASHKNLEKMIEKGKFREDLFFRINEAKVVIPSLSEHEEDIPALINYFAKQIVEANNLQDKSFDPEVIAFLKRKRWRGNIRELKAYLRKIILLADNNKIDLRSLKSIGLIEQNDSERNFPKDLQEAKKVFVQAHVKKVLAEHKGNKTRAAQAMGITTRNLYRLLPEKSDNFDLVN